MSEEKPPNLSFVTVYCIKLRIMFKCNNQSPFEMQGIWGRCAMRHMGHGSQKMTHCHCHLWSLYTNMTEFW